MKQKKSQSADLIQQHVACLRESDLTHIVVTLLCNSLKNISFVDTAIRLIKASGTPSLFKSIFNTLPSIVTQPTSATERSNYEAMFEKLKVERYISCEDFFYTYSASPLQRLVGEKIFGKKEAAKTLKDVKQQWEEQAKQIEKLISLEKTLLSENDLTVEEERELSAQAEQLKEQTRYAVPREAFSHLLNQRSAELFHKFFTQPKLSDQDFNEFFQKPIDPQFTYYNTQGDALSLSYKGMEEYLNYNMRCATIFLSRVADGETFEKYWQYAKKDRQAPKIAKVKKAAEALEVAEAAKTAKVSEAVKAAKAAKVSESTEDAKTLKAAKDAELDKATQDVKAAQKALQDAEKALEEMSKYLIVEEDNKLHILSQLIKHLIAQDRISEYAKAIKYIEERKAIWDEPMNKDHDLFYSQIGQYYFSTDRISEGIKNWYSLKLNNEMAPSLLALIVMGLSLCMELSQQEKETHLTHFATLLSIPPGDKAELIAWLKVGCNVTDIDVYEKQTHALAQKLATNGLNEMIENVFQIKQVMFFALQDKPDIIIDKFTLPERSSSDYQPLALSIQALSICTITPKLIAKIGDIAKSLKAKQLQLKTKLDLASIYLKIADYYAQSKDQYALWYHNADELLAECRQVFTKTDDSDHRHMHPSQKILDLHCVLFFHAIKTNSDSAATILAFIEKIDNKSAAILSTLMSLRAEEAVYESEDEVEEAEASTKKQPSTPEKPKEEDASNDQSAVEGSAPAANYVQDEKEAPAPAPATPEEEPKVAELLSGSAQVAERPAPAADFEHTVRTQQKLTPEQKIHAYHQKIKQQLHRVSTEEIQSKSTGCVKWIYKGKTYVSYDPKVAPLDPYRKLYGTIAYDEMDKKKFPPLQKKFEHALSKGLVPPTGHTGVKKMKDPAKAEKYEIKLCTEDARILNKDPILISNDDKKLVVFDIFIANHSRVEDYLCLGSSMQFFYSPDEEARLMQGEM